MRGSNDIAGLPPVLRPPVATNVALLLDSRIPARLAWTSAGATRLIPIWFVWNGATLAMATFAGSAKLTELDDGDQVAVSIDTETFPYRSLRMGGPITLAHVSGLAKEYRDAAERYLGPTLAARWCQWLGDRDQVVIRLTPTWARATDMSQSPFFSDGG